LFFIVFFDFYVVVRVGLKKSGIDFEFPRIANVQNIFFNNDFIAFVESSDDDLFLFGFERVAIRGARWCCGWRAF
jgi:hypothetical protein